MTAFRFLPRARPRLLPALIAALAVLLGVKAEGLLRGPGATLVAPARAVGPSPAVAQTAPAVTPPPAQRPGPARAAGAGNPAGAAATAAECEAPPPGALQVAAAERAVLESLRARREELEGRERAAAEREMLLAAAERRIGQRIEELAALQQRLEATDRARSDREEQGWRQMVKLYEGMRPRDAAAIFDELDLPVLIQILDRMGERKASPVLGAMRPERARLVTAELARHRAVQRPASE